MKNIRMQKYFWLFIAPWVIGFLAFTLIPMVYSFVISFTNWNGHSAIEFKGITNYINIFTKDKTFWLALKIRLCTLSCLCL
mgnify:CR=1 FL=1